MPRPLDLVLCGETLGDVELIENVRIDVERHHRRVPSLVCNVDHAAPFVDQQGYEAVTKVVGASALQVDSAAGGLPGVAVPALPGPVVPDSAGAVGKEQYLTTGPTAEKPPLGKVALRAVHFAERFTSAKPK